MTDTTTRPLDAPATRPAGTPGDSPASDPATEQLNEHRAVLAEVDALLPTVQAIIDVACRAFERGGRLYSFGNGGSAADAQHLAAELVGRYKRERRPLPAVALSVDPSVVTCIGNDYDFDQVFARQVEALARPGDIVVGFSTSGRSANVIAGLEAGRRAGATTILFGGADGGPAATHADHALLAPSKTTARIQEVHLLLLHLVSDGIDAWAAGETPAER